ncbi:MAG: STAS/SEC14 domain-containing protein [Deltaproteobacteria bacterium]|nr:STAS/SEC14 domain-containing protein [Deltaproteobacteria bacterium]
MSIGPHAFLNGRLQWFLIDGLSLSICRAHAITDEEWTHYLEGIMQLTRDQAATPWGSVAHFAGAYPSSAQRRITADFVKKNALPKLHVALLTDSRTLLGALTALAWLVPSMNARAFPPLDIDLALQWLGTVKPFDRALAKACVEKAWRILDASFPEVARAR